MKKGTILITLGLLLITAAFSLVGYNLYESYRAGKAAESIMEELEQAIADAEAARTTDGADSSGNTSDVENEGVADSSEEAFSEGNSGNKKASGNQNSASGDGSSTGSIPTDESEETNLGELYPDRDMPSVSVNSIAYAGWIFIPSLSMRLPVQSTWNYGMLDISPAIYSGSVYQNNMIIGGHSYITHFRSLRNIAPGARVTFFDTEGFSYEYEVEYSMSLNPNQGAVLFDDKNEQWDLTLFTCNTGGQTRCIVRCVRI